jgi:hypothetical protein
MSLCYGGQGCKSALCLLKVAGWGWVGKTLPAQRTTGELNAIHRCLGHNLVVFWVTSLEIRTEVQN